MEILKKPTVHCRLSSATLSQLAFPGESDPNFPWEKSLQDSKVVKKKKKKKERKKKEETHTHKTVCNNCIVNRAGRL